MSDAPGKSAINLKSATARLAIVAAAAAVFAVIHLLPEPEPLRAGGELVRLTGPGKACLAIMVAAVILWLTEAMPFAVTSLLLLIIMPFFGITEGLEYAKDGAIHHTTGFRQGFNQLVSISFGHRILFFFVGVFFLSAAVSSSGLGRRMMLYILRFSGGSPRRLVFGMILGGMFTSMWVTNMATAAIMAPLGLEVLRRFDLKPLESNFGRALMLACCWGPMFGGIATPAGCGPNPIAIAYLRDMAGFELTFLDWIKLGVPASLIMAPVGLAVLMFLYPPEMKELSIGPGEFKKEIEALGPLSRKEWWTLAIFVAVIAAWISSAKIKEWTGGAVDLPMEWVAMIGGSMLMFPGIEVMSLEEAEKTTPWAVILLVMASMGLGLMMDQTGAARWMAWVLMGKVGLVHPVLRIAVVVLALLIIKVFLASNTVTGIIIIPLLINLARDLGISPWMLVAPAALASSLGMVLITQAPTNIIPYSTGYFTVRDFMKSGLIMSVLVILILTFVISVIGPLTGMYNF